MLSIKEMRTRLPKEFMEFLYEKYTPVKVDQILLGMTEDRYTTLRVNNLKYDIQSLMRYFKEKNIKFERVPWYKDALIIKNADEKQMQKLDIYEKGYIYIQSLSSMIPPLVLNPNARRKSARFNSGSWKQNNRISNINEKRGIYFSKRIGQDKI